MADAASIKVGKTPVQIVGGGGAPLGGARVLIQNRSSSGELVIGGPDVADGGWSIDAGQQLDIGAFPAGSELWAVRGGSTDVTAQVLAI
jgi:hypothetical protein